MLHPDLPPINYATLRVPSFVARALELLAPHTCHAVPRSVTPQPPPRSDCPSSSPHYLSGHLLLLHSRLWRRSERPLRSCPPPFPRPPRPSTSAALHPLQSPQSHRSAINRLAPFLSPEHRLPSSPELAPNATRRVASYATRSPVVVSCATKSQARHYPTPSRVKARSMNPRGDLAGPPHGGSFLTSDGSRRRQLEARAGNASRLPASHQPQAVCGRCEGDQEQPRRVLSDAHAVGRG